MFRSLPVRPTEIPEDNIFVCESKYIEGGNENTTRKIAKGFKPPPISSDTCPDEIYYFPKKISLKRVRQSIMVHTVVIIVADNYCLNITCCAITLFSLSMKLFILTFTM